MTERELQDAILDLCRYLGALAYHTHDSRRSAAGWPDLAIVTKDGRFLLREVKTAKGRVSKAQQEWLDALRGAGVDAGVWRPCDWPERIKAELSSINNGAH